MKNPTMPDVKQWLGVKYYVSDMYNEGAIKGPIVGSYVQEFPAPLWPYPYQGNETRWPRAFFWFCECGSWGIHQ